ncbi:MAG: hypothetical protein ACLTQN_01840 [Blautia massiliensis (ex Durand et al. 2017)]
MKDTFSLENSEEEIIQELETRIQTFYFEEVKSQTRCRSTFAEK